MLAVTGFVGDANCFVKTVKQRLEVRRCRCWSPSLTCLQSYRHAHDKDMALRAIARMIQTILYGRRFFPYYVYNILGGIEADGVSAPIQSSTTLLTARRHGCGVLLRPCWILRAGGMSCCRLCTVAAATLPRQPGLSVRLSTVR